MTDEKDLTDYNAALDDLEHVIAWKDVEKWQASIVARLGATCQGGSSEATALIVLGMATLFTMELDEDDVSMVCDVILRKMKRQDVGVFRVRKVDVFHTKDKAKA